MSRSLSLARCRNGSVNRGLYTKILSAQGLSAVRFGYEALGSAVSMTLAFLYWKHQNRIMSPTKSTIHFTPCPPFCRFAIYHSFLFYIQHSPATAKPLHNHRAVPSYSSLVRFATPFSLPTDHVSNSRPSPLPSCISALNRTGRPSDDRG